MYVSFSVSADPSPFPSPWGFELECELPPPLVVVMAGPDARVVKVAAGKGLTGKWRSEATSLFK